MVKNVRASKEEWEKSAEKRRLEREAAAAEDRLINLEEEEESSDKATSFLKMKSGYKKTSDKKRAKQCAEKVKELEEKKEKKKRIVSIWVCILIFIGAFFAGMISKVAIKPAWSTKYTATWSEELGTKITDISYGDEEANKFDLYLPKDSTKDTYGLFILHCR